MSTIRFSRYVARAALALALVSAGCEKREAKAPAPSGGGAVGTVAPSFALPDLEGNVVRSDALRGKVAIVDFWATWCGPCVREVPHFVRLQSKYRAQGLVIVGLSLDAGGARDVRPFVDEHGVNYTMLIADDETAKAWGGITGIPTTFVLDRDGKIVKRFLGETPPEVFEEAIRPLLATTAS